MIYRAKAPLRLGFGGGGTDVPPFVDKYGGCVLNATINKYAYATLVINDTNEVSITSRDYQQTISCKSGETLQYDGNLDLIKAVLNKVSHLPGFIPFRGCEVFVRTDMPPGVGMGTSSTVVVAVLGAFLEYSRIRLNPYQIAELAWEIERVDLGYAGGKQDQYAATFGGVNLIEFRLFNGPVVNTLRLSKKVFNELQHNLLLCYTGLRHVSHDVIREQQELTPSKVSSLEHLKDIAVAMKEDLLTDDLGNFGNLLSSDWFHKKSLSSKVTNQDIESLVEEATRLGAEGLKITGAGGGGVLIIYCNWRTKHQIANAMSERGCQIMDYTITATGLETWVV
jgi:D-glycero-alpha-D-manno-heptose-7-phosphate kinase